jgi:Mg-chelatase subunit ChlD
LLCLALCAVAVFLVGRASAQGTEPLPLDVLLLIDHSNSLWDKDGVGADPDLLRVQAANLFIAYLGVDTARTGNRLGIIHFGGSSELVVPLTPLDSAGRRQAIRAAIADPRRMDWTDPLEALQLAYETLFPPGQRDPARQPVAILLSDGKPELFSSPKERAAYVADLRALVGRFREQGCPIFTIAHLSRRRRQAVRRRTRRAGHRDLGEWTDDQYHHRGGWSGPGETRRPAQRPGAASAPAATRRCARSTR